MKRSKKVELVLITAVLAACNRTLVPPASKNFFPEDPTLTTAAVERDTACDPCNQAISSVWNYSFSNASPYACVIIINQPCEPYYPGIIYRKGTSWKNEHLIVRGGFGKTWFQSVSS